MKGIHLLIKFGVQSELLCQNKLGTTVAGHKSNYLQSTLKCPLPVSVATQVGHMSSQSKSFFNKLARQELIRNLFLFILYYSALSSSKNRVKLN